MYLLIGSFARNHPEWPHVNYTRCGYGEYSTYNPMHLPKRMVDCDSLNQSVLISRGLSKQIDEKQDNCRFRSYLHGQDLPSPTDPLSSVAP